jgi:TIM-barrel protein
MRLIFPNRLVLSAMAGVNNAEFCMNHPVGLAILGGFSADKASIEAARKAVKRGRREFVFEEPVEGIEEEVKKLLNSSFKGVFAINIRSAKIDGYLNAAEIARKYRGIVEINAHCRQPEFIGIKCGQWLIFHPEELCRIVNEVVKIAPVSVKVRGGLGVNYSKVASMLRKAGCQIIHIDAMIPGGGCDLSLVKEISKGGFTIGNNSVIDVESAEGMLKAGARMVSAARAVLKDRSFFKKLLISEVLKKSVKLEINFNS